MGLLNTTPDYAHLLPYMGLLNTTPDDAHAYIKGAKAFLFYSGSELLGIGQETLGIG